MKSSLFKTTPLISYSLLVALCISFTACVKDINEYVVPVTSNVTDIDALVAPATFNYEADKAINATIIIKDNYDMPIPDVTVRLMDKTPEEGGVVLGIGNTDANGNLIVDFRMEQSASKVIINTSYIGLPDDVVATINGNTISCTLGGSNPQRIYCAEQFEKNYTRVISNRIFSVPTKTYLGTWNGNGVPDYLETSRDLISASFLSRINYSLPERRAVPTYHPEYLTNSAPTTLYLIDSADVWITFVHEGAGFTNALAFYTYPTGSLPTSTTDVNNIKIIFPNMSFVGSGGGLVSGDKVHIGSFNAGTSIGFVVLANGYNTNNTSITNGCGQYYSDNVLNPEGSSNNQHTVVLYDSVEQKFVIGFEDLNRSSTSCDNDFNDAIFFATTNPINAISRTGCPGNNPPVDTDGDGVTDINDDYPTDADKAYNCFYPSVNAFARVCFEDLWPAKGDFDMNDLIVAYRYNTVKNARNKVVQLDAKFSVQGAGGSFQNGFGIQLPIASSLVSSVTGARLTHNYINNNANGCEAGQAKAVIIAFDNALNIITRPPGYFVNTQTGAPYSISDTINLNIVFTAPQTTVQLGTAPYNPFIIVNMNRSVEVHLPNKEPTDLVNMALFGTMQDNSNPSSGRYYKTSQNLPFALNVPAGYNTILEKSSIMQGYNYFSTWVQTGGAQYSNWYSTAAGYQNSNYIYRH